MAEERSGAGDHAGDGSGGGTAGRTSSDTGGDASGDTAGGRHSVPDEGRTTVLGGGGDAGSGEAGSGGTGSGGTGSGGTGTATRDATDTVADRPGPSESPTVRSTTGTPAGDGPGGPGGGGGTAPPSLARRGPSVDVGALVRRIARVIALVLRIAGLLAAVVIVADVALTLAGADRDQGAGAVARTAADALVGGFDDLFRLPDPTQSLLANHGLAAVVWIVVGLIASRIVTRAGALLTGR